ncbi:MAG: deoxyuridine 5'-triphosphate nucleotidohydrolase [Bacillota bacterium]|nr:deoxyuridine 5'-triphosphate nucleotidohydrolase [Bacillota bacterium]
MEIKENELLFAKIEENAIIPTKREEDAGYDVYTCETDTIVVKPCSVRMINTGLAIACNKAYFPKFFDKGGMDSKGIVVGAGVGDSGYRDKYFVPLNNINEDKWLIITNQSEKEIKTSTCFDLKENKLIDDIIPDKISVIDDRYVNKKNCIIKYINKAFAQFVVLPVPALETKEVTYDKLLQYKSERGLGKLGSSGK